MRKSILLGILATMVMLAVVAYGHSEDGFGWYMEDMHEEMEQVLESGAFEDLQQLREEYNMPIMHWVDDEQEFEQASQLHEENGFWGGCMG